MFSIPLSYISFARSSGRPFVHSFVRSLVGSFDSVRSFVRSFVRFRSLRAAICYCGIFCAVPSIDGCILVCGNR